jgi:hypothetical protein
VEDDRSLREADQPDQNILSYFDPIIVDLTVRDSIVSPTDSTQMVDVFAVADFIYHSEHRDCGEQPARPCVWPWRISHLSDGAGSQYSSCWRLK